MNTDPDRWFRSGHTSKIVTPNPQATLIPQGPAPGARMTKENNHMEINLGDKARDRITGYEGTVTVMAQYLTGPDRACLESIHDGEIKHEYFDLERLELTG